MEYHHITETSLIQKIEHAAGKTIASETQALCAELKHVPAAARQAALDTASVLLDMGYSKGTLQSVLRRELPPDHDNELSRGIRTLDVILDKNQFKVPPAALSKFILAHSSDIRIVIALIARALFRVRFLSEWPKERQNALCQNVFEIWVPITHKLGLHNVRWELEDLAMKQTLPSEYDAIQTAVKETREQREEKSAELTAYLNQKMQEAHLDTAVFGRVKNFYRIYQKMKSQKRTFGQIHDLLGARIICQTPADCYRALSVIQNELDLKTEGYDDYIAKPKPTGYRSIHVNLTWRDTPSEIQIRTWNMHKDAEDGVVAHWEYKQHQKDPAFDHRLSLAKQITDWLRDPSNRHAIDALQVRFEQKRIYVLTPLNELVELPGGATPVDFAFAVHTELGYKCEKARVNGKTVPLSHALQNGDSVEILTSEKAAPKQIWLSFAKTEKARQKIRSRLQIKPKGEPVKTASAAKIQLRKNAAIEPARCCNPLPGDDIIGVKTTKRKIRIHRADCANAQRIPQKQRLLVSNTALKARQFEATLKLRAHNRAGLLAEILNTLSATRTQIISTEADTRTHYFTCRFRLKTKNRKDFEEALARVQRITGVEEAARA